ncbi:GNAT family N-acetyltransferase [Vibrio ostreicida]|uniref:GNAT family N-acetyltransferase n=1 Tax=Vibrio ostreicida TaxID=526588 RepID=UPI003B5B50BB
MNTFFSLLNDAAKRANQRFGMVLRGQRDWQITTLAVAKQVYADSTVFQLGGEIQPEVTRYVNVKKGQQLLGQECGLLICDFSDGFDANSFSAALGCVHGGGGVIILPTLRPVQSLGAQWLDTAFCQLLQLEQGKALPDLPVFATDQGQPLAEQKCAIEKIRKVVEGHRKRPLVLTADRGRGKSSALGLAASEMMPLRKLRILVTAPSLATVQPVFEHAHQHLPGSTLKKGHLQSDASELIFIAPDELLRTEPECDCLFVDEAATIPIAMLQKMVARYHRCVFSSTVHGYEGCGRGFTVKFQTWLKQHRPQAVFFHLDQPIRWNTQDPLEKWLFETFLLDSELKTPLLQGTTEWQLEAIDKQEWIHDSGKLKACFALLVNAHYQTSPNDLMLILDDQAIQLLGCFIDGLCVGCILTIAEGGLDADLINAVQHGRRRPKGHLVPTMLANHLGLSEAASQTSVRIMRIAIHPDFQQQGIGSAFIKQLAALTTHDFISTSFGATSELIQFWSNNGFSIVKLGVQRDNASGCHSVAMIKGDTRWLADAKRHYAQSFRFLISESFADIETDIVRNLIPKGDASTASLRQRPLIERYCLGGGSYESVAIFVEEWLLSSHQALTCSSDLLIRKVLQRWSWKACSQEFALAGRKQSETQFRADLLALINTLKS